MLEDNSPDALDLVRKVQEEWQLNQAQEALLAQVAAALDEFEFEQALSHMTETP